MPRLFTAVEVPESIRTDLARLKAPLPGARWIEPENMHITLRFVGDVDNHKARDFADLLAGVSADAFSLRISGLGAFGGNDPRVIWAGVEPSESLDALARAHERAARSAGFPAEARSFKPHVTIARLRHCRADRVARLLARIGAFRSEPFFVSRFILFSSKPNSGGGPYVIEEAYPLAGGYAGDDDEFDPSGEWA